MLIPKKYYLWVLILLFAVIGCTKEEAPPKDKEEIQKGKFLDDWTYDVNTSDNGTFKNTFKLWVPEGVQPRAILALSVGGLGDGTNMVKNPEWKAFAEKEKLALVGAYVTGNFEEGAINLKVAVNEIAKARELEGIIGLPYLLRGHSSGGIFSYAFSQFYNRSTLAWANIKGTMTNYNEMLPPGLFIVGESDLESRNRSIESAFLAQRKVGGVAVYASEPKAGHGAGDSDLIIRSFFSAVLEKVIDDEGNVTSIDTSEVFLGNNQSLAVWPYNEYPDNKLEASCLIDSTFSAAWINFANE